MTTEPADTLALASQPAESLRALNAELLGDCRWTYQQNQAVLAALKKDNKELKALLAQLPASNTNVAQVALEAELRGLSLQANALRKQHDRLVQDRLSSTSKLAQLKDSLKDLHCDSQLVFSESPGSRLVKQLQQKLTAALTKHDAAQATCQSLEETAQQLREHRQTHESQLAAVEEVLGGRKAELEELLASHKAVQLAKDQAKADLMVAEQELRGNRAARDAQLQHHSSLVQQRQDEYQALHQGAMQRLQQWRRHLPTQLGPAAKPTRSEAPAAHQAGPIGQQPTSAIGLADDAQSDRRTEEAVSTAEATDPPTEEAATLAGAADTSTDNAVSIAAATDATAEGTHEPAQALSPQAETKDEAPAIPSTVDTITADISQQKDETSAADASPADTDKDQKVTAATAAATAIPADASAANTAASDAATSTECATGATAASTSPVATIEEDAASQGSASAAAAVVMSESDLPSGDSAVSGVQRDQPDQLSSRHAFAAAQYATGVTDMMDLVDRFLTQDETQLALQQLKEQSQAYLHDLQERSATLQMTLEELQVGRSLLHRQAEAAIQEADAQIKLNKGQYDHVGRLLVHVKAAVQGLISMLEPLFPEIAGMSVSSDGLIEAIHGCELRLVHAHEAVLVSQAKSFSKVSAFAVAERDVSKEQMELVATDLKPMVCEDEPGQQEGVSSTLRLPDVA